MWKILAILLLCLPAAATVVTGRVTDGTGQNFTGEIRLRLSYPASCQLCTPAAYLITAGPTIRVQNGVVASTFVHANTSLSPSGTYWLASMYDVTGRLVDERPHVITGATYDLGAASMLPITTSNVSFLDLTGLRSINGAYYTSSTVSLQSAINSAGTSGKVVIPCGTYTSIAPITVSTEGAFIQGYGLCSKININHMGDAFDVTGALFKLRDVEIVIGTTASRAGAAILDIQAGQGTVENVRITGAAGSTQNGMMFKMENASADSWSFGRIRFSGGHPWQSAWRMMGTANTVASTKIVDAGGNPTWTDALFDIDGAIDTLQISTLDTPTTSGKIFRVRNTVGGIVDPRWIQCSNCSIESAGGTAIDLVTSQDFTYHGYIATATIGVDVGAGAKETDLSAIQFTNIAQNAVVIRDGSIGTNVVNNFFTDTGNAGGVFDSILVKANADDFNISGNRWRAGATIPQNCVEIEVGNSNVYTLRDNMCPATARSVAAITNGGTGGVFTVDNNTDTANKYGNGISSTWNDIMIANNALRARGGVANDTGNLALTSSTGIQTAQALELATSLKVGASGTAVTQYRVFVPTIDPAIVAANTSAEQTFGGIGGLAVADKCFVSKPTVTAGLVVTNCRVSAVDTVALTFGNLTAAGIDAPSETYTIVAIRN